MIAHQLTLIRREAWEHPAIWVTPMVTAVVVALLTLTGQVSVSAFGEAIDLAIVGAQNVDEGHRKAVLTGVLLVVTSVFAVGAWIVMVFYSLDALYAERKDKSILFWRSLPITDAETVLSKLLTALIVVPLVTLVVTFATHLVVMLLTSIWIKVQGGSAMHLLWAPAPLADVWASCLVFALAMPLWLAPLVGWFLFVSAFTKRSPFLTGFLPLIVLPLLEKMLVGTNLFAEAIFARSVQPPLFDFGELEDLEAQVQSMGAAGNISLFEQIDLLRFLASPSLWAGLVVCGLFAAAAIYVRRYRDESY